MDRRFVFSRSLASVRLTFSSWSRGLHRPDPESSFQRAAHRQRVLFRWTEILDVVIENDKPRFLNFGQQFSLQEHSVACSVAGYFGDFQKSIYKANCASADWRI